MPIEQLNPLVLPDGLPVLRNPGLTLNETAEGHAGEYDQKTLFYDAIHQPDRKQVCLVCPKFLALKQLFTNGSFFADGKRLKPVLKNYTGRFGEVWLRVPSPPFQLVFQYRSHRFDIHLSEQDGKTFKGLNCGVLKSKNNDLQWISDWANYHVKVHGLQGLLLFDNNSSRYTLDELEQCLQAVAGLEQIRVIAAPFPYGLNQRQEDKHGTKYLTPGLLNIARLRYMQTARAVLHTDVDELLQPIPQDTIFDMTLRSPIGYVAFHGRWRYPPIKTIEGICHADHTYKSIRNPRISARKYCVRPDGLFGRLRWGTHRVLYRFARFRWVRRLLTTHVVEYWHFRRVSTCWKNSRDIPQAGQLVKDPVVEKLLLEVIPGTRVQGPRS